VRQIAHRAREHVRARRPRYDTDRRTVQAVMTGFQQTLSTGDIQGLMDLMAPDVVLLSDGGGKVQAARRPIVGADKVARFMYGISLKATGTVRLEVVPVNGALGWAVYVDGVIYAVIQLVLENGRITQLLLVANPDKLRGMSAEQPLSL